MIERRVDKLYNSSYLGVDAIRTEDRYRSAIPHAGRALHGAAAVALHRLVDAGEEVVVESGKVQFAQIPGVVHVPQKDVHILGGAEACG